MAKMDAGGWGTFVASTAVAASGALGKHSSFGSEQLLGMSSGSASAAGVAGMGISAGFILASTYVCARLLSRSD